jgi:hypothetical protein
MTFFIKSSLSSLAAHYAILSARVSKEPAACQEFLLAIRVQSAINHGP